MQQHSCTHSTRNKHQSNQTNFKTPPQEHMHADTNEQRLTNQLTEAE